MKNLNYNVSGLFLILLVAPFIVGCASEPVKVDLPANHPASPGAQEANFIPPPNPFQEDVTAMKIEPAPDSMMKHKTLDESGQKHMRHNMKTKKSGHGEDDNQHKGHSQ